MGYDEEYERRKQALEARKRRTVSANNNSQRTDRSADQTARRQGSQNSQNSQNVEARRSAQQTQTRRASLGNDPYDRPTQTRRSAASSQSRQEAVRRRMEDEQPMKKQSGKKQLSVKQKKRKRNRRILFAIEAILLVLVLACMFVISKWDLIQKASFGKKDVYVSELSDNVIESMQGYSTIAVFGVDNRTTETGRSDVIMMININNETKDCQLISVLRDTYWNVPDASTGNEDKYAKANNAYHTGGAINALKALNKNLDLNITDYVTVNWYAVSLAIDYLGGVWVDVPETMMGEINGYITETVQSTGRGSVQLESSGYQHLDGIQAVAYCRIRHNNGGDDGRAQRQREVVSLMLQQAKQAGPDVLLQTCNVVFPEVSTNLTLAQVIGMATGANDYNITSTIAFPYHQVDALVGTASVKVPLGLADDVTTLHQELFGDYSYTPSSTVLQISNQIEANTGYGIDDRR